MIVYCTTRKVIYLGTYCNILVRLQNRLTTCDNQIKSIQRKNRGKSDSGYSNQLSSVVLINVVNGILICMI